MASPDTIVITIDSENKVDVYVPQSRSVMEVGELVSQVGSMMTAGNYKFSLEKE